jgi:hypothetical protein
MHPQKGMAPGDRRLLIAEPQLGQLGAATGRTIGSAAATKSDGGRLRARRILALATSGGICFRFKARLSQYLK